MRQLFLLVFVTSLLAFISAIDWDEETALDEYVHYDDGYFSWEVLDSYRYEGVTLYFLNMTSQKWMDETFSDRPIWYHRMLIAIPDEIADPGAGILGITGGDNDPDRPLPPKNDSEPFFVAFFANRTKTAVGYIHEIPNQPIVFVDDRKQMSRTEDDITAFTWKWFMWTNATDPTMIIRLPMTKGAKRGLDTLQEFVYQELGNNITRFAVGGGSKRGWTTWMLAATDRRVTFAIPIVFSVLNFPTTLMKHFQAMNEAWSFAFNPWYNEGLTWVMLTNPLALDIWIYEDPYTYKERLTMPKLVISGVGDEFFLLDDSYNWWNDLPQPMWFMMNPNADHALFPQYIAITRTVISALNDWLEYKPKPNMTWEMEWFDGGGRVVAYTEEVPFTVTVFEAVTANSSRRDFRWFAGPDEDELEFQNIFWFKRNVTVIDDYTYEYIAEEVEGFWVGAFIEAKFGAPLDDYFQQTTEVLVVPNTWPGDPCTTPAECHSVMV